MKRNSFVKALSLFLCLMAVLFVLSACAGEHKEEGSLPTAAQPTADSGCVKELSCIRPSATPALLPAEGGGILVCWSDYEATTTHLCIVDIADNTVSTSLDLEGCYDLFPERFSDNGFVLRDFENGEWLFLDSELRTASVFPSESMDGFFSHDRSGFYYLKDKKLYRADTAEGGFSPVKLPTDLRFSQIVGFHPTENVIALHVYISPFGTDCGTAILDLDSGAFSMVQNRLYQTTFGESFVKLLHFDDEFMQYEVTYCGSEGARRIAASRFAPNGELVSVSGADYLIGVGSSTVLYRLSDGVASCPLGENGISGGLRDVCWVAEGGMLVGSVWHDTSAAIYAVYPELLPFSKVDAAEVTETPLAVDDSICEGYWGKLTGNSLPESMQGLRELADRIEQEYDVQILLSDQCEELAGYCNFDLVLTTVMSESEETERTAHFLSSLERGLSMYPDGFFGQFRSAAKDEGIYFFPVEHVISDNGVVGIFYEGSNWFAITLDITVDDMVGYLCHEIWHATENKILGDDYTAFADEAWRAFNPDGFRYTEEMDAPDVNPHRWTLFTEEADAYFIDDYARTTGKEDRARLMEYVIARPAYREQIESSPALMAKLQYMRDAINRYFDTTGWSATPWDGAVE